MNNLIRLTHLVAFTAAAVVTTVSAAETSMDMKPHQLGVGDAVPALTLRTSENQPFDLHAEVLKQPTVLIFYRGGWCPYCNAHLSALVGIEDDLRAMGVRLIAISPDQPSKLYDAPKREKKPNYELISDQDATAIDAFGISYVLSPEMVARYKNSYDIDLEAASGRTHHKLPHPAVFVVDRQGIIRFAHVDPNFKVRLAPEKILEAAKTVTMHATAPAM